MRELTPRGRGGVSVLELTGSGPLERFEALAGKHGDLAVPRLVRLRVGDEELDEALVWRRPDGALELHLHGSPVLVERLVELLGEGPGGDSSKDSRSSAATSSSLGKRSIEDRASELLAGAPCQAAARCLLDQVEGALRAELLALAGRLATGDLAGAAARSRRLAQRGEACRLLFEPARVVLAGPVNAGKSTLFNLLVGERRVVVSDEEGTTRDRIEARTHLGAYALDLVDTAGERSVEGAAAELESRGQAAGRAERRLADLVLWLDPAGGAGPSSEVPLLALRSRADEGPAPPVAGPSSGRAGLPEIRALADPAGTLALVAEQFHSVLGLSPEPWSPGRGLPFDVATRAACGRLAELLAARDALAAEAELAALLA